MTATLRAFDDPTLTALLRHRPDLAVPAPSDFEALATRARTPASVSRALDNLDAAALRVLDGLRLITDNPIDHPVTTTERLSEITNEPATAHRALQRLRDLALVWGPDDALRFPAALSEAAGPYPAGLGRPAAELSRESAELVDDPAALRRQVLAASPQARSVLNRLAAGPPIGTVTDAFTTEPADTPVRWLIAHHLLVPVADDTVELPREVGVLLRRESGPLGSIAPEPTVRTDARPGAAAVDSAGAAQVWEVVRSTTTLLEAMADDPVGEVRAGGIGSQALQRLARAAELSTGQAAVLLEAAYGAGLLGRDGDSWLPAHQFDAWRAAPVSVQWARLARAWFESTRDIRLLTGTPGRSRPAGVLSAALLSRSAPRYRYEALTILAAEPPGTTVDPEAVVAAVGWRHPRRRTDDAIRAVLDQAATLGVVARDALTGFGRLLLTPPDDTDPLGIHSPGTDPLVAALDDLLPPPVEHLVVQSDLTVVVPGYPSALLAAELALLTDRESANGYRIGEASLRRAMDAGYAAEDIVGVFTRRSHGELPQALRYLIDDVARRHGGLRAGVAGSYLRSQDEALLTQVLADRRLADADLRRLAPTVLVSTMPLPVLLTMLRSTGQAPVAEDANGSVVIDRSEANRAALPVRPEADTQPLPRLDPAPLAALVEQLRQQDSRATEPGRARSVTGEIAEILRQAVPARELMWVEYVDTRGDTVRRLLRPVSLGDGFLRAEDRRTDMLHTIALHSIHSVTIASV